MTTPPEHGGSLPTSDRILSAGLIIGPTAFVGSWLLSGALTNGYSPIRDHISDLAAAGAPTQTLMNVGFTAFAVSIGAATVPAARLFGTPTAVVFGANVLVTVGIMLAPLGRSPEGDRAHAVVAGLGYLILAATAPSAARTLAKRSRRLGLASLAVGATSLVCLGLSLVRPESGFWQRAGITTTDAWLIAIGLGAVAGTLDPRE